MKKLFFVCVLPIFFGQAMQKPNEISSEQLPFLVNALPVEIWARIIALKCEEFGGLRKIKRNAEVNGAAVSEKLYSGPNKAGLILNNLGYIRRGNGFVYRVKVVDANNKSLISEQLITNDNSGTIILGLHPVKNKFFALNNDHKITSYRVNLPDKFDLISLKKKHVFSVSKTIPLSYDFMVYDVSQRRDNAFLTSLIPSKDEDGLLVCIKKENNNLLVRNMLTLGDIKKACLVLPSEGDVAVRLTGLEFMLAQRSLFLVHVALAKKSTDNATPGNHNADQATRLVKIKTLMCRNNVDMCEVLDVYPGLVSWDQPEDYQRKNSFKDKFKPHYLLTLQDPIRAAITFVDTYRKKFEDSIAVEKSKNYCLKSFNGTHLRRF